MEWATHSLRVIGLALSAAGAATSQDWRGFRGPNGQGLAWEQELPPRYSADDIVWRRPVGVGHSSPVVVGDRLYLTRVVTGQEAREVVCLDADTGEERWAHRESFSSYPLHRLNNAASSSPVADADGVYVTWVSGGDLVALALDPDGELRWRRALGPFMAQHGGGGSPVLHGTALIVANDHDADGFVAALDVGTGEDVWRLARSAVPKRCSYALPVIRQRGDGAELLLTAGGGVTAVDSATGLVTWDLDLGLRARCVGVPVLIGERMVLTAGTGGSGKEGAVIMLPDAGDDEPVARVSYRLRRSLPYVPAMIAIGDRLFMFSDGGIVTCVELASGDVIWRQRLEGDFFSSPVSDGRTIYIADRDGVLWSLAVDDQFRLLGQLDLDESVSATPAIARGGLYLRTSRDLVHFRVPQK